jgi:hypothetical protein
VSALDQYGCDLATGRLDRDGYAYHGKSRGHIVAYVAKHGPVPEGLEIDHACRRRHCRSWWHLEAVTPSENGRRKSWAYRVRMKTCPRGHDMALNAVVTPERGRVCRTCNRAAGAT